MAGVAGVLLAAAAPANALARDADDEDAEPAGSYPNFYIDFRSNFASIPANSLAIGLGDSSLFAALSQIVTLGRLSNLPNAPSRPNLTAPASQGIGVDVPLTVDLNDRFSLYGGFSGSASTNDLTGWSDLSVTSWFAGLQADVYRQDGGALPGLTLLATLTRAVPDAPLATTSVNVIAEANYAFDKDESRGLLAGLQLTHVDVDTPAARIGNTVAAYAGAYYQNDDNWKITGRIGLQSFDGAQLLSRTSIPGYTQPLLRFDLDRMDDDDNRLFGITAQIAWVPKPSYFLTLRTPLYLNRK